MTQSESASRTDPRFPCGPWVGYYRQGCTQSRQRLTLTFANGCMSGTGTDPCGPFTIRGDYDVVTGESWWAKIYSTHRIHYGGCAVEGDGIAGMWNLVPVAGALRDHGEFHIWPDEVARESAGSVAVEQPTVLETARE